MTRVHIAPPHHRRPCFEAVEKSRCDVAVLLGHDDLHRDLGVANYGMPEALPHVGAVER